MASAITIEKLKEIATCTMCSGLMQHPVNIHCGHSYCLLCILTVVKEKPWFKRFQCPHCGFTFEEGHWVYNNSLERLVELIQEMEKTEQELLCETHGERLQLFCEDDGQLICWRCERGPQHQGHATALVEDVCQGYKEKLEKAGRNLNLLQEECMNQKVFITTQITKWKDKIEIWRQKIKSDFKNLHTFLQEEEKLYLWRLEKEEEQMLRRLRESEANLQQKSEELKSHILEMEAKCQGSAQYLLQDVRGTLSRTCAVKLEVPEVFPLEIHTVCDVAKLYLDVKGILRLHEVNVTLDSDTAHPALTLSKDRRQVAHGCSWQNLKFSPGRFTAFPCVLGCESFTSGKHFFEVDVGEGTAWDVGVCMENVERGLSMKQVPELGFWAIRRGTQNGYVALTSPHTALELHERPLVVGVALDYEAGAVSFYNMTSGSHIFTFPKASFSGTLRPYFQVNETSPLSLLSCVM